MAFSPQVIPTCVFLEHARFVCLFRNDCACKVYVRELARVLQYLGATKDEKLLIGCTHPYQAHASIDRSIAVHPTGRSHTGVTVALGRGVLYSKSTARKINTTSCCEAELITLVKGLQQSVFLAYFLAGQGNQQLPVIVSQDNESTIKLIENGRSNSERTRHIEIVIYISEPRTDVYCPTGEMMADYFTKPLQSTLFNYLREKIMGENSIQPRDIRINSHHTTDFIELYNVGLCCVITLSGSESLFCILLPQRDSS